MRRERVKRRRFPLGDGTALTVHYWLLTEERREGRWYGISVTDSRGRAVRLPCLFQSRWEARRVLGRLAKGCVTTVTAKDVVEDYLWERSQR